MKKKNLYPALILFFLVSSIVCLFTFKQNLLPVKADALSAQQAVKTEINPTIQAALQDAEKQENPLEKWSEMVQLSSADDTTILYALEGFIHGQVIQGEGTPDEIVYDSDTDPNATTLGEIRQAIREHYNLNE